MGELSTNSVLVRGKCGWQVLAWRILGEESRRQECFC